jgi:ATP-dependent DNA helicase RecG
LGGSIFIRQYRDRLTIENPGGFPLGITIENVLDRQSPRNRLIAKIFGFAGLVERSGQGMNLIYEMCVREAKPLPDFRGTDTYFVFMTLNGKIMDDKFPVLLRRISEEMLDSFTTDDYLAVQALYFDNKLPSRLSVSVKKLTQMGIVESRGSNNYTLASGFQKALGRSVTIDNPSTSNSKTDRELILEYLLRNMKEGASLRELQQLFPERSFNQLQVLIRGLRKAGRVYSKGKANTARWYLASETQL